MIAKLSRKLEQSRNESGFTLIELLVVIVIIGILAAIALPIYMEQQKLAIAATVQSDARNTVAELQSALTRYPNAEGFILYGEGDTPVYSFISPVLGNNVAAVPTANVPIPDGYVGVRRVESADNTVVVVDIADSGDNALSATSDGSWDGYIVHAESTKTGYWYEFNSLTGEYSDGTGSPSDPGAGGPGGNGGGGTVAPGGNLAVAFISNSDARPGYGSTADRYNFTLNGWADCTAGNTQITNSTLEYSVNGGSFTSLIINQQYSSIIVGDIPTAAVSSGDEIVIKYTTGCTGPGGTTMGEYEFPAINFDTAKFPTVNLNDFDLQVSGNNTVWSVGIPSCDAGTVYSPFNFTPQLDYYYDSDNGSGSGGFWGSMTEDMFTGNQITIPMSDLEDAYGVGQLHVTRALMDMTGSCTEDPAGNLNIFYTKQFYTDVNVDFYTS